MLSQGEAREVCLLVFKRQRQGYKILELYRQVKRATLKLFKVQLIKKDQTTLLQETDKYQCYKTKPMNITQTVNIFQCLHDIFLSDTFITHNKEDIIICSMQCTKLFSCLHNEYTMNTRKYHHKLVCFSVVCIAQQLCLHNKQNYISQQFSSYHRFSVKPFVNLGVHYEQITHQK